MSRAVRGGRESLLALPLLLASALLLGASLVGAQTAAELRQHQRALASKSHGALLGLFALDSRLAQARTELAHIQTRVARLQTQQQQAREELTIVTQNLRVSQRLLGAHLRTLYEEGEPNALAILLGANSLDDAVTRLNEIEQSARQGADAVRETRSGRARLAQLAEKLDAQIQEAQALETRARETTALLAAAREQRVAYLRSLARNRQFTARQIHSLDAHARRVVDKAQAVQAQTPARVPSVVAAGSAITVTATGYSLPGRTSSGLPVGPGVVAVDPAVIPLGTRLTIPGYGEGVAADTGSAVSGYVIDLWFPTLADALAWGKRTVTITLH
jgi:3D (Asp-Asp-Asp) domain-containing protein